MVLLLLDHGASNAVKDADGRTPADVAQAVNHQEVADLIRRYRAKE
jgi:ankyrin repeat protein